jgi:cobalt-zinc-cadmium efflux system outer membrane protein
MIPLLLASLLLTQGTGDSLSLGAALARARAHRGQVLVSVAQVAAARAGVRVAGTLPNPVASYGYSQDPPRQHASLDQSFDWLLTRGADRAVARSGVRRALADSSQSAADLAAEVRSAFYGAVAARELGTLVDAQGAVADSLAVLGARRVVSGDISEVERDQLVLEAVRAGQRRSRAREAAAIAWTRLARAIGWDTTEPRPAQLSGSLDDGLSPLSDSESARPVASSSPLIQAAVADSVAAAERARRASLARMPLPSLMAGADWDDPGGQRGALAVFGLSIPLPLWQRGNGALAVARAEAAQAAATTAEVRLETARQLSEARTRLTEAAGRARVARDSLLPVARRLRERATAAYRAGETGIIPLLEALRAERDVTAETVDDLLGYQEALAAWKRTLGEAE